MALVLIGFMGAGKSRCARRLAERRGVQPLDSDTLLVQRLGHSIAQEFDRAGEAGFRAAEEQVVCELLADAGERDVVALGGGSVLCERVRQALSEHLTALIEVDPQTAWARVSARKDGSERPLAGDRAGFEALHAERQELYERVADASLTWAESASGEYPVIVGRGLLDPARLGALWPLDRERSRAFCVSDRNVAPLYSERLGGVTELIEIDPGEPHKTLASAESVWSALAAGGMTRADHLVALGGGVVGDLAGFCAATYQRGVPVVHVPTTLVAQVDSAYGGKTGVDLAAAKNYVGAYHQPAAVIVDPDTLASLPAAEHAAGYAEVLKTALIAGGELWRRVAAEAPLDQRTILACARTKLQVVAEDERDGGRRQALNLGHTVAHAIEAVSGYRRYRHGEAVALGLLVALRLSGLPELREQVRELLHAQGLPVALDGEIGVEQVLAATRHDKKRLDDYVPFVLLDEPGVVRTGCRVGEQQLRAAVAELYG
ncbi:MAG TPA: bifunctional shikimate kinase/3-dehydroquinate synthase [Solirubrobacteraceae bacterium]|nr:bifunctional shikimate kinase/3-dehydroquinate synthase [Solirubrobacteraceae bacterium]